MRRRHVAVVLALSLTLASLAESAPARAQPAADTKARAKELYGLGNERFDRADYQGAAEAYRQAYELVHYPIILFNLALSYEGLAKPVETIRTLEQLLGAPGKLRPERIARARTLLTTQKRLVAELDVRCNVEGATLRIDGEEVGSFPLPQPVQVASGRIIVEATREGYRASYATVQAAGGHRLPVNLELAESAKRAAQLKVNTSLPGAELWVDSQLVAVTPLRATLPLVPDERHRVELRREGYRTASEHVTLGEGALGEIDLEPEESREDVLASGGELHLSLAQADASVLVNGKRREVPPSGTLRLPAGVHFVMAERDGYDPLSLHVEVPARGRADAAIDLIPTPETRARLIGDAELDRGLGWGLTTGGLVFAGVGTGLLVWSLGRRSHARSEFDAVGARPDYLENKDAYDLERGGYATTADTMTGVAIGSGIGIGVGAAGLVAGIVFLVTGDDPDSFELRIDDELFAVRVAPRLATASRGGLVGLRGSF